MTRWTFVAWVAVCTVTGIAAQAQDYPARPVTLVVPYAAGGGNDVMARLVGERMSKTRRRWCARRG